MKLVLNRCFGGFSISLEAGEWMAAHGSDRAAAELRESPKLKTVDKWHGYGYVKGFKDGYDRRDPILVACVEALGDRASGNMAQLKVVEIPDHIEYEIDDYDGIERVAETHRSWP